MTARYEFFVDPGEFWLVWDRYEELPVECGGRALIGLSLHQAETFCRLLNELDDCLPTRQWGAGIMAGQKQRIH